MDILGWRGHLLPLLLGCLAFLKVRWRGNHSILTAGGYEIIKDSWIDGESNVGNMAGQT